MSEALKHFLHVKTFCGLVQAVKKYHYLWFDERPILRYITFCRQQRRSQILLLVQNRFLTFRLFANDHCRCVSSRQHRTQT